LIRLNKKVDRTRTYDIITLSKEFIMFLTKDYVLASELVHKMGIHLANISMLRKKYEHNDDLYSIRRMNSLLFVNKKARQLPNNIRNGLNSYKFTDLSTLLPYNYINREFAVSEKEWEQSGIIIAKTVIANKKFYVFSEEFAKTVKQYVPYILNKEETEDCTKNKTIRGSIQLSKNKFFTWY